MLILSVILKKSNAMKVLIPKNIPCSFAYKSVCIGNKFTKSIIIYRGKNAAYEFIKVIFEY